MSGLCSIGYGVGVLRLFRWGVDIYNYRVYVGTLATMVILQIWALSMSDKVKKDYNKDNYNPIHASLYYIWKTLPQVNVFVDAY
jgi:hypothetical protein